MFIWFLTWRGGLLLQLRETVARQEKRIQTLEKQVSYPLISCPRFSPPERLAQFFIFFSCHVQIDEQQKENERLWEAINRSALLRQAGCDNNGNHQPHSFPRRDLEGGGFPKHGGRSAGAGV